MKFNILTLFPDMFSAVNTSMVGRAVKKGLIDFNVVNIRDFSTDKHKKTDDMPFGGGQGMLLMAQPLWGAMKSVGAQNKRVIYMSPRGKLMDQNLIENLAQEEEIVILCGHYEGVDQRVLDYWNCEEVSIGDYVLTGGELASMVMIDAVARMIPGVLASREAAVDESVYSGLLEYPQYTQPRSFEGLDVPEVLLNGNHQLIHLWKLEQALRLTKERRPDLFQDFLLRREELTRPERKVLDKVISEGSEDEQGK